MLLLMHADTLYYLIYGKSNSNTDESIKIWKQRIQKGNGKEKKEKDAQTDRQTDG